MKIALIGATGYVGSHLLKELLLRGHDVTAVARDTRTLQPQARLGVRQFDFNDADALKAALAGADAVVIAVKFQASDPSRILSAAAEAGVKRVLVIGGAGSLRTISGADLVDTPQMPEQWKPEARAAREFLEKLRAEQVLDWTFVSPSALLQNGERTGKFRIGGDALLVDENGESRISLPDLAIAVADELERSKHSRQRFTVGY